MILISKSPYRVSLLGGSSDLDWFVNKNKKGLVLGFSISAYSVIILKKRNNSQKGILNYSSREEYSNINNITHPIIRSSFQRFSINYPLELVSIGDNLSGGGLGSSSSFTVALVNALSELNNKPISNSEVANIASNIEIEDLGNPIGRQDQYLSALGGVNVLEFMVGKINRKEISPNLKEAIISYSKNLFLINTNIRRNSSIPLKKIENNNNSFSCIKKLLYVAEKFLKESHNKNQLEIKNLLHKAIKESWDIKRNMPGVMNNELFDIESKLKYNGFEVLKLLGAGSGGYFLVSLNENSPEKVKYLSNLINLQINNFDIDNKGLEIIKI